MPAVGDLFQVEEGNGCHKGHRAYRTIRSCDGPGIGHAEATPKDKVGVQGYNDRQEDAEKEGPEDLGIVWAV